MTPEETEIKRIIACLMSHSCVWHGTQKGMKLPRYMRDGGSVHFFATISGLVFNIASIIWFEKEKVSGLSRHPDPAKDIVHTRLEMWVEDQSARTGRRKPMQKVYMPPDHPLHADAKALFDSIARTAKVFRPNKMDRASELSALKVILAAIE